MDSIINFIWFSFGICTGIAVCLFIFAKTMKPDYEYKPMATLKDKGEG